MPDRRSPRPRRLAGIGLGAATGVAAVALLTSTIGGGVPGVVGPPAASAAGRLPAFEDCADLRQWYVDAALPLVGAWGFGSGAMPVQFAPRMSDGLAATGAESAGRLDTGDAVGNGATGTNVQEGGVDEPDVAKTDGRTVYRVQGRQLVVTDVSGPEARQIAEIRLPGGRWEQRELLLVGDTVLVVSTGQRFGVGPMLDSADLMIWPGPVSDRTRLVAVDVADPGAPRVTSDQLVDGDLVAAREYGDGTVRLVTDTGLPPFDFVTPNRDRSAKEAKRVNRDLVRASTVEDWLPGIRPAGGDKRSLLGCDQVRHPEKPAGLGTLTVLTFDAADPSDVDAVAVTAAGDLVYSSADRLYVATMETRWWEPRPLGASRPGKVGESHTQLHAFTLEDDTTTYTASGEVRGTVRDRWSLSEHDGRLRVATALGERWRPRENAVTVLEEDGEELRVVGTVAGLGPDESIQSVRWFGDLAVVVTFRETDPLYTLDLSDPTAPRVLGALKIRGFSGYLHPLGDDLLLGLGRDATLRGRDLGAQAATFDLGDLAAVVRTDTLGLGRADWFAATEDPRAFTYLPGQRLALAAVSSWRNGSRVLALHVAEDGSLREGQSWPTAGGSDGRVRALPLGDGKVALVDREVRVIDVR